MTKIDISEGWEKAHLPKLFGTPMSTAPGGPLSGLLHAGSTGIGEKSSIMLMKGAVPTTPNSLLTLSTRASDILVSFNTGQNGAYGDFTTCDLTVNPVIISTDYKVAVATGTATWFWWVSGWGGYDHRDPITGIELDYGLYQTIFGTVGILNSGADMILDTGVNVVAGESYRISYFEVKIPTKFGY